MKPTVASGVWVLALTALGLSGCRQTDAHGSSTVWPFGYGGQAANRPLTPREHLVELHDTAEVAHRWSPEEQEQLAQQLANGLKEEKDPLIRRQVLRTLGVMNAPTARDLLKRGMQDPDPDVRIACCESWAHSGAAESVDMLTQAVTQDADPDVRLAAARCLGGVGDRRAVAALGVLLEDPNPAMQHRAVTALETITGERLGNDVNAWLAYVRSGAPERPLTVAERLRKVLR